MQNYDQYRKTELNAADNGKILVLLYDGAINYLNKAKQSIIKNDTESKANFINHAHDIIQELQFSLSIDVGGEIAQSLNSLYQFMLMHLMKAKISKKGDEKIDDVISMLRSLNEAWREIISKPDTNKNITAGQYSNHVISRRISA